MFENNNNNDNNDKNNNNDNHNKHNNNNDNHNKNNNNDNHDKNNKNNNNNNNPLIITDFTLCDFSLIYNHILQERENKKTISKEEKQKIKEEREKEDEKYKFAIVDGEIQEVGNFRLEPSSIYLGRGCNPMSGKIKERIYPEDIIINIGKGEEIPKLPEFYKNHHWLDVVNNRHAEWLASWTEGTYDKRKYVWLSSKSKFKEKSDIDKFEFARKLKKNIVKIRLTNFNNLTSSHTDIKVKQMACALYLIDTLALRVGNEVGDDKADTVGVCTLRVEHIKFIDDNDGNDNNDNNDSNNDNNDSNNDGNNGNNENNVNNTYNGNKNNKKSSKNNYQSKNNKNNNKNNNKTIIQLSFLGKDSIQYKKTAIIEPIIYTYLIEFIKGKNKNDELFDQINSTMLNNYLGTMMKGLTAKVFRTYNACILFQNEINIINDKFLKDKIQQSDKIQLLLDAYNKANLKVAMLCNHQKKISKTFKEQIAKINTNTNGLNNKLIDLEEVKEKKQRENKDIKTINQRIKKIKHQIKELKAKKKLKNETKNLSIETSKTNYIDPRITVAFFKKNKIPLEGNMNDTYLQKFKWALDVDENWLF